MPQHSLPRPPPPPPPQLCLPLSFIPKLLVPGPLSPFALLHEALNRCCPALASSFRFQNAQLWVFRHYEAGRVFPHHPAGSSKCRVIVSWCQSPSPLARGGAARIEPRRKTCFWKHPKVGTPEAKGVCLLSCTLAIAPPLQIHTRRARLG